jgi:MFS family permease
MVVPFLQDFARPWGVGGGELGLVFGVYALAQLITIPFAGRLCDRIGSGNAVRLGASGLLLSLVLFASAQNDDMLFIARAIQGAADAISWTGGLGLLAAAYPAERRGRALGIAMGGMSLGTVVGLSVGGRLFDWGGMRMPFLIFAGWTAFVLAALFIVRLPAGLRLVPDCPPATRRQRLQSYGATLGVVVLGAMLMSGLEPTLPTDLESRLGAHPSIIGNLFAIAALAYGLASPIAGWAVDRWGARSVMAFGIVASAVVLPVAALPTRWWGEAAALAAFGGALAFLLAPTLPEIAAACERNGDKTFGAAYGVFNFVYAVGMVSGQVAGGELSAIFGFGPTLLIFAAITAAYLPVLLRPVAKPQAAVPLLRRAG